MEHPTFKAAVKHLEETPTPLKHQTDLSNRLPPLVVTSQAQKPNTETVMEALIRGWPLGGSLLLKR